MVSGYLCNKKRSIGIIESKRFVHLALQRVEYFSKLTVSTFMRLIDYCCVDEDIGMRGSPG